MMDHVILIQSDQSNLFFSNNKPYHFKIRLDEPLLLEEEWRISLLDFCSLEKVTVKKSNRHELYIFCDVCSGDNIFNNQFSLLRRIFPTKPNNWNYIFSPPIYIPIKRMKFLNLNFI